MIKIDVDNEDLADIVDENRVSNVPVLIYSRGGRKLYRRAGFADDATLKALESKYLL